MSHRVFISYRREDCSEHALLVRESLQRLLGLEADHIFLDTHAIPPGTAWPAEILNALDRADLVLVLIGPGWLSAKDQWERRRIDKDEDWVRLEICRALETGKTVIPILVGESELPPPEALPQSIRGLTEREYFKLRNDCWDRDVEALHNEISAQIGPLPGRKAEESKDLPAQHDEESKGPEEYLRALQRFPIANRRASFAASPTQKPFEDLSTFAIPLSLRFVPPEEVRREVGATRASIRARPD